MLTALTCLLRNNLYGFDLIRKSLSINKSSLVEKACIPQCEPIRQRGFKTREQI